MRARPIAPLVFPTFLSFLTASFLALFLAPRSMEQAMHGPLGVNQSHRGENGGAEGERDQGPEQDVCHTAPSL